MDLLARFSQKPKYLVGIDLDGTLLQNDHQVSAVNRKAILDAQANGIAISLISGRSHCGFLHYLNELDILAPCAGDAGSIVFDPLSLEIYQNMILTAPQVRHIYDQVQGENVTTFLHDAETVIYNREAPILSAYASVTPACRYQKQPNLIQEYCREASKVAFIAEPQVLTILTERILSVEPDLSITSSGLSIIEISAAGANKGTALHFIAGMLEIPPENTIAIGDSGNDYEMLRQAAVAVAVDNALEGVKDLADFISPSNEADGVAWVLTQLMRHGSLR
jgi:hypothetical protein